MFRPDPRVGDRQRACAEEHCRRQRRAQTQRSWRSRNPSYQACYRLQKRAVTAVAAASGEPVAPPAPLRLPADLTTFPWDLAKTALGFTGAELLAMLAIVLVRMVNEVKDERLGEKPLSMQGYAPTGRDP
jgi:hypothetical protein